jgi:hypothetical protein
MFQDEPRGATSARTLPDFEITAAEVQALLADPSGHGLSRYLLQHAEQAVKAGSGLKTPFRVLWYAENLGLTDEFAVGGHKDSRAISLHEILNQINQSNRMNGKPEISLSTVHNALSPLANALTTAFRIRLLIDRKGESIKMMSEVWAQQFFSNQRQDIERKVKQFADVLEQSERAGIPTAGILAGHDMGKEIARLTAAVSRSVMEVAA